MPIATKQTVRRNLALTASMVLMCGVAACGSKPDDTETTATTNTTTATADGGTATTTTTTTAAAAPAADNTDTVAGVKLASYQGDATSGKAVFTQCMSCHSIEAGKNMIGPSLHAVVGRAAGSIAGFAYSAANKGSGITWSEDKLFQYLEHPQRVVPGTKMTFTGVADPQKRADVIAYLKSNS